MYVWLSHAMLLVPQLHSGPKGHGQRGQGLPPQGGGVRSDCTPTRQGSTPMEPRGRTDPSFPGLSQALVLNKGDSSPACQGHPNLQSTQANPKIALWRQHQKPNLRGQSVDTATLPSQPRNTSHTPTYSPSCTTSMAAPRNGACDPNTRVQAQAPGSSQSFTTSLSPDPRWRLILEAWPAIPSLSSQMPPHSLSTQCLPWCPPHPPASIAGHQCG